MPVAYAIASVSGKPGAVNQDAAVARQETDDRPFVAVVADGHGDKYLEPTLAAAFARFVAAGVTDALSRTGASAVPEGFDEVAAAADIEGFHPEVGAVVAGIAFVASRRELVVAHAGDVRLYANVRAPKPYAFVGRKIRMGFRYFTRDHTPNHPAEIERLRPFLRQGDRFAVREHAPNSSYSWGGSTGIVRLHRVLPNGKLGEGLMISRGFGDASHRPAYTHVPDVQTIALEGPLEGAMFALCSDGARRNVGRAFKRFEASDGKDSPQAYADEFLDLHREDDWGDNEDDDATAIFFRLDG